MQRCDHSTVQISNEETVTDERHKTKNRQATLTTLSACYISFRLTSSDKYPPITMKEDSDHIRLKWPTLYRKFILGHRTAKILVRMRPMFLFPMKSAYLTTPFSVVCRKRAAAEPSSHHVKTELRARCIFSQRATDNPEPPDYCTEVFGKGRGEALSTFLHF